MTKSKPKSPSTRTAKSLGKVIYSTRPNQTNLAAGFVIASILFFGGLWYGGFAISRLLQERGVNAGERDWTSLACVAFATFASMTVGVGVAIWVWMMNSFRLHVCQEGFYYDHRGRQHVFAWDEIVRVREYIDYEHPPLVGGVAAQLMEKQKSRRYSVIRCDGKAFHFSKNVLPSTSLLAGPLKSAARNHGFDWITKEE